MEIIVYGFGQGSANAAYFYQIIDTCGNDTLEPTELAQKLAALFRTKAGNALER
jgi:hypothetical protein